MEGSMKSILAASVVALLSTFPAFAQTSGGNTRMMMCQIMPADSYEDAETEATLEWKQLVACADAYREQRQRELTAAMPAKATQQSGGAGTADLPPANVGSEPRR